jgi:hypothetical protein
MPRPVKSFPSISAAMVAIKEELAGGKDFSIRINDQERPVIIAVEIDRERTQDPHAFSEKEAPEPIVKTAAESLSAKAEEPPSVLSTGNELSSVL